VDGPVTASLDASLRRAVTLVAVGWQALMVWTVLVTDPVRPRWSLVAAHVTLALVILLILRGRGYLVVAGVAVYVVGWYDFTAAPSLDSALFLAACWTWNTMNLIVMLVGRRRLAAIIPMAVSLACGVLLDAFSPIGSPMLVSSLAVTAAAIAAAGAVAVPQLWALAEDADCAAEQAQAELQAAALAAGIAREAADDARILHDTVINTLAAIAIGGAAVEDQGLVRDRCRHDLSAVGALVGKRVAAAPQSLSRLDPVVGEGFVVRRTGLSDQAVLALEAELPESVSRAINAAVRELVRNSIKHAGTGEVVVEVRRTESEAVVVVADEGRGFDGVAVAGRGLEQSVVGRIADVGGRVDIESAPGRGTRAVITCALEAPEPQEETGDVLPDPEILADRIRGRACWLWSAGLVLVGVVIEAVNRPGVLSPTYLMLALVALSGGLAWGTTRHRRGAPAWLLVLLVACVPIAYLAGLAGAGFGHGDVFHYQAWGLTPLLVMLLTLGRGGRAFVAGLVVLTVTAVITAIVVTAESQKAGAVVVVAVGPAIGLAVAWLEFHRMIGQILRRAHGDRRAALRLHLETAARQASNTVRARWRAAELDNSLHLLEGIADGELSPVAPLVRRKCGSEEAYLRQLTQLSPDAFRMAVPLTRALALAHGRSVELVVRTGSVDTPDETATTTLGGVVLDAVSALDAGDALTVGLFQGPAGPQLTLVAPAPHLGERLPEWGLGDVRWNVRHQVLGAQEMVEIGWISGDSDLHSEFSLHNAHDGDAVPVGGAVRTA